MGIAKAAAELLGYPAPEKWTDIEENIFIPYNTEASVIPEYGGMNGSVEIKQADVVLINYPLEFRLNESQALGDLDFVSSLQSRVPVSEISILTPLSTPAPNPPTAPP